MALQSVCCIGRVNNVQDLKDARHWLHIGLHSEESLFGLSCKTKSIVMKHFINP